MGKKKRKRKKLSKTTKTAILCGITELIIGIILMILQKLINW